MTEWKEYRLGEVFELCGGQIQTGPFGSQLHESDYEAEGVAVIMPKDISANKINHETIAHISIEKAERLKRHKVKEGDIVFPRRGDITKHALISKDDEGLLCGTGCLKLSVPKNNLLDSRFLSYYLSLSEVTEELENRAVGSTMMNLSTKTIAGLDLVLPPLSEQQRIASFLSAYDELIETNNRRIALLEESARELYKEWFVRFRFPGHEHTKFVRGLPEGWEETRITDLVDIKYGKDHKHLEDGEIPVYGSGGIMRMGNKALFSGESVLIPRKGSLNNIMLVRGDFWTIDTMFYSEAKYACVNKMIYYFLSAVDMESFNSGAALPSMTTNILQGIKMALPPIQIRERFDGNLENSFVAINSLKQQNASLSTTRDQLLPRLINGKLKV